MIITYKHIYCTHIPVPVYVHRQTQKEGGLKKEGGAGEHVRRAGSPPITSLYCSLPHLRVSVPVHLFYG